MKKASSLLLSLVVFISSAPREGFTQVVQSVSFMGSGIAPFALESYMEPRVITVRGDLAERGSSEGQESASPYSAYRIKWSEISPAAELKGLDDPIREIGTPLKPETRRRLQDPYTQATLGDFDANLHRLVYAERSRGERMMDKVGDFGLTLKSLMNSPEEDDAWDRPFVAAERREQELTGEGLEIPGLTGEIDGSDTIRSVVSESSYNAAADNRIESVDVTTEYGAFKNRIQTAQNTSGRLMKSAAGESAWGSALFILNEAAFRNKLGETRFNLNYEHYEAGYFKPLEGGILTERRGYTAAATHQFTDKVKAGVSLRGTAEDIHTQDPFAIESTTPGVNASLQPFSGSKHELLRNFQVTGSADQRTRQSTTGWVNDRLDAAYLTLQNQYKRLTLRYDNRRSSDRYLLYDVKWNEERHRLRLDYDLQYMDMDITPFVSFDVTAPEKADSTEEVRAGTDIEKEISERYKVNTQVYSGAARQRKPQGLSNDASPLMGLDVTLSLAPDCFLIGSFRMSAPSAGTTQPNAAGDVKFTKKF